jgi:hypothetical protein
VVEKFKLFSKVGLVLGGSEGRWTEETFDSASFADSFRVMGCRERGEKLKKLIFDKKNINIFERISLMECLMNCLK